MDIKVEDGFMSTENGLSNEASSDPIPIIVKVKSEFIAEIEDEVNYASNANICHQVENDARDIKTEPMDIWPEDGALADTGAQLYTSVDSFVISEVVPKKEEVVEEKEDLAPALDARYSVALCGSNEDLGNDDKTFQTEIMCKEIKEISRSESDSLANSVHISPCYSEFFLAKDSVDSGSCPTDASLKLEIVSNNVQGGDISVVSEESYQGDGLFICSEEQFSDNNVALDKQSTRLQNGSSAQNGVSLDVQGKAKCRLDVDVNDECAPSVAASWKKRHRSKCTVAGLVKKRLPCTECTSTFDYKSQLSRHLATVHTTEKPFSCPYCSMAFNYKGNMKRHSILHSSETPFACPHCDSKYKTQSALKSHIADHYNVKPYECLQCLAKFKTKLGYKLHKASHSNERPFACKDCPLTFKTRPNFRRHVFVHSNNKPHSCTQCSATFRTKNGLNSHSTVHSSSKPFTCLHCSSAFKTKENLKIHISRHISKKRHTCSQCSGTFSSKKYLRTHIKTVHVDHRSFTCQFCAAVFKTKSALIQHLPVRSTENQPFSCMPCDARFKSNGQLSEHLALHPVKRPFSREQHPDGKVKGVPFVCLHCGGKYKTKAGVKLHIAVHLNEKLFSCEKCSAMLKLDPLLGGESALSSSRKSFICEHCSAKFKSKLTLRLHSAVHLKDKLCASCAFYIG